MGCCELKSLASLCIFFTPIVYKAQKSRWLGKISLRFDLG
jgi:hypothetical protein